MGSNPATPTVTKIGSNKEYACEEHRRDSEPDPVKLAIEVPFDELKPSLQKAYREIGAAGFRYRASVAARSPRPSSTSGSAAAPC